MKRAAQIARELNIGISTLGYYMEIVGEVLSNPNQKIDPKTEIQISELTKKKDLPTKQQTKEIQEETIFHTQKQILTSIGLQSHLIFGE